MAGRVNPNSVLGQGLMNSRPELAEQLKKHEEEVDRESGGGDINLDLLEQVRKMQAQLEADQREKERLKADLEKMTNRAIDLKRTHTYEELKRRCVPQTIGVTGIHPDVLDIKIEESKSSRIVSVGKENAARDMAEREHPTYIAWVPVVLHAVPIQSERNPWFFPKDRNGQPKLDEKGQPTKIPNFDLGQTRIAESRATVRVLDKNGNSVEVSITGIAILNMARLTPAEIERRLDRAETKANWEQRSHPEEEPEGTEGEAHGEEPLTCEAPPFMVQNQTVRASKMESRTDKSGSPNDDAIE